ncbi:MAG TPA: hypothetical protein VJ583_05485, partial [Nitrososphaeraceae archaeon]|nr:hypothetical protein [Nitrososphaeraceae archaeon]
PVIALLLFRLLLINNRGLWLSSFLPRNFFNYFILYLTNIIAEGRCKNLKHCIYRCQIIE